MRAAHHPIRLAARLAGWRPHVLRIWEQRYHAVEPCWTAAHHRVHSQNNLERLGLLRDVRRAGHSISQVARHLNDVLRALAVNDPGLEFQASRAPAATFGTDALPGERLASVQSLDGRAFDDTLNRAAEAGTGGRLDPRLSWRRRESARRVDPAARRLAASRFAPCPNGSGSYPPTPT